MSIVDDFEARADLKREDIARFEDEIAGHEAAITTLRERIARIELETVESKVAANILREMGLRVTRTDEGLAHVTVDRTLAEVTPDA